MRSFEPFHFMHWAKTWVGRVPFCLGSSGVTPPAEGEFDPWKGVGLSSPTENYFGDLELRRAVAQMHRVDVNSILISEGTSLANATAIPVLAPAGSRVLVEAPTYPVLAELPRFSGAQVERLARRPERNWEPDLDEIRELTEPSRSGLRPPVSLVVLTRLHNPSGADLSSEFLAGLALLAEERGFFVLVDEVFFPFLEDATPAHRYSSRFVSTGSVTKAFGFGDLRVGWVVGATDVIRAIGEYSFYLQVDGAHRAQAAGIRVIQAQEALLERSRRVARAGREIVDSWIASRGDVSWVRPAGGITGFVRFEGEMHTASLATHLREERGVNLAEGEFFGMSGWARICYGGSPESLRRGLSVLGEVLDERARRGTKAPTLA